METIHSFSNVVGYKINFRKSVVSLYSTNKHTEKDIMEHSIESDTKISWNKSDEGCERSPQRKLQISRRRLRKILKTGKTR